MKYSYASLALVLAVAQAQNIADLPPCSISCFTSALLSDGCATLTDFKCHCSKPELISQVQPCVQGACSPQEVATVISAAQQLCAGVGVPLTLASTGGASSPPAESANASPTPAEETTAAVAPAPTESPTGEEETPATESPTAQETTSTPSLSVYVPVVTTDATETQATETEEDTASPTEEATTQAETLIPATSTSLVTSAATGGLVPQPTTVGGGSNNVTSPTTTPVPYTGAATHITGASFTALLGLIVAALYVL
jgi:hypothetical protein